MMTTRARSGQLREQCGRSTDLAPPAEALVRHLRPRREDRDVVGLPLGRRVVDPS